MAGEFIWRGPEEARQAIAQMQVGAAAAENASRERIAKEQTQQQRYATQSQMAEREKDRTVSREDIASRERSRTGTGTDAASRERGNIQYQTILGEISEADPMTKRELEARIAASPMISEDLAKNLRSVRDRAYKIAKDNYDMGERLAKNYRTELNGKKPTDPALTDIYKQLKSDKNVIFDRATGNVESVFRPPREDAAPSALLGATRPGGVFPSASELQAGGRGSAGIPTIADIRSRVTGAVAPAFMEAADAPTLPPTQSTITNQPSPGFVPRGTDFAVPLSFESTDIAPRSRVARSTDFAVPPILQGPPFAIGEDPTLPRMADYSMPYGPPNHAAMFNALPRVSSSIPAPRSIDGLLQFIQHPNFGRLPMAEQQSVLNEIQSFQGIPRAYDMNSIRPEYIPMDPYYAPQ